MNKTILLVFAFILTASLVFAAGPREEPNGSSAPMLISERLNLNEFQNSTFDERIQLREDRLKNMSERVELKASMLKARINATANFGQCVSDMAKERNSCYNISRMVLNECKNATTNNTVARACNAESRKDMQVCKDAFKSAKKGKCGQIKANFMEKIRYAFK